MVGLVSAKNLDAVVFCFREAALFREGSDEGSDGYVRMCRFLFWFFGGDQLEFQLRDKRTARRDE